MGVNWDDKNDTPSIEIDLVEMGIAISVNDNCKSTELWTDETVNFPGAKFSFSKIPPHSHEILKVKCLPF